jgi:hypothetical protein
MPLKLPGQHHSENLLGPFAQNGADGLSGNNHQWPDKHKGRARRDLRDHVFILLKIWDRFSESRHLLASLAPWGTRLQVQHTSIPSGGIKMSR